MSDKYKYLCNLQGKCDLLSPKDSIELTELIKKGQCVEIAIHVMELLVKADQPKHETVDLLFKRGRVLLLRVLELDGDLYQTDLGGAIREYVAETQQSRIATPSVDTKDGE